MLMFQAQRLQNFVPSRNKTLEIQRKGFYGHTIKYFLIHWHFILNILTLLSFPLLQSFQRFYIEKIITKIHTSDSFQILEKCAFDIFQDYFDMLGPNIFPNLIFVTLIFKIRDLIRTVVCSSILFSTINTRSQKNHHSGRQNSIAADHAYLKFTVKWDSEYLWDMS